jgi:rubredoxin
MQGIGPQNQGRAGGKVEVLTVSCFCPDTKDKKVTKAKRKFAYQTSAAISKVETAKCINAN